MLRWRGLETDKEYCEGCFYFHILFASLVPEGKQFIPVCTKYRVSYIPISEIDICGVKREKIPECIGLTRLKDTTKGVLSNG